jgi:hypothetical protein
MIAPTSSRLLLVALLGGALALTGCDSTDTASRAGRYDGPAKTLGTGTVNTFATLDEDGTPLTVGVRVTETALATLPAQGGPHGSVENILALPKNAAVAPYDHVSFDWMPQGHEPDGVYSIPHFDVHFYLMSEAERATINPADPEFDVKASRMPDPQHIPAGYSLPVPVAVPMMGAHWVGLTSPEFTPAGFSRTFIYGFWDGKMNFVEPMITKAFMESVKTLDGQSVTVQIPQPQAFEKAGYYPTAYSVRYDATAKAYEIILENLTTR